MSFDEEHLDEHYECQQAYEAVKAERDALAAELSGYKESHEKYCPSAARVRELEAALRGLFDEIDSRFGSIADMSPELLDVMMQANAALAPKEP